MNANMACGGVGRNSIERGKVVDLWSHKPDFVPDRAVRAALKGQPTDCRAIQTLVGPGLATTPANVCSHLQNSEAVAGLRLRLWHVLRLLAAVPFKAIAFIGIFLLVVGEILAQKVEPARDWRDRDEDGLP